MPVNTCSRLAITPLRASCLLKRVAPCQPDTAAYSNRHLVITVSMLDCLPAEDAAGCTIAINVTTSGSYLLDILQAGQPLTCSSSAVAACNMPLNLTVRPQQVRSCCCHAMPCIWQLCRKVDAVLEKMLSQQSQLVPTCLLCQWGVDRHAITQVPASQHERPRTSTGICCYTGLSTQQERSRQ